MTTKTTKQAVQRHAPESHKTRRVREKLQKHWEDVEKRVTPAALQEALDEIHRWIARHAHCRVPLRDKNIALFDENQNAAKISQRVTAIAKKLHEEMLVFSNAIRPVEPV